MKTTCRKKKMKKKTAAYLMLAILLVGLACGVFSESFKGALGDDSSGGTKTDPYSWPMFHNDGAHSGFSTSTGPVTNHILWDTQGVEYSSPVVVGDVVYVGSGDGNVYGLDASTGAILWSYATGSSVDSSPAVASGVVYVGTEGFWGTVSPIGSIF